MIETVISTELPIDENLVIKKNRLSNGTAMRRVCIVSGTHGDELEGQYVCFRLAQLIGENIQSLNGTVEIYPALNPLGIDSITRGIPGFDLDMNRIFPGDPQGTMAESVAYAIARDLTGADLVIDIHSSNIFLREIPQARINIQTAERLVPWARMLNVDFIWIHDAATVLESTLAHTLNKAGTPTLVVEMGVGMRINHGYGNRLVDGILNLLNRMGMWDREVDASKLACPVLSAGDEVSFINAGASGIFLTDIKNNIIVERGQEIGRIVSSLTGQVLERITAKGRGLLFTLRAYPVVYAGSLIARIHNLQKEEDR